MSATAPLPVGETEQFVYIGVDSSCVSEAVKCRKSRREKEREGKRERGKKYGVLSSSYRVFTGVGQFTLLLLTSQEETRLPSASSTVDDVGRTRWVDSQHHFYDVYSPL